MSIRARGSRRYRTFTAAVVACYGMLALLATSPHSHTYPLARIGGLASSTDSGIDAGVAPAASPGAGDPGSSCWLCTHSRILTGPAHPDPATRNLESVTPGPPDSALAPRTPGARAGTRLRAPPLI